MEDQLNLSLFREYDVCTPSEALTPELAHRLAAAEAVYFRQVLGVSGVVVGCDARRSGPRYVAQAIDVFRRSGLDVVYLPGASTASYFYFAAMRHPQHAAVMFGASHKAADVTGQKILGPGVEPIAQRIGPDGGLDKIKELYVRGVTRESDRRGRIRAGQWLDDYVRHSLQLAGVPADGLQGTRVLHDYLYGAAGPEMMLAFGQAGADLRPLHFTPDGSFPLGAPGPGKPHVIASGRQALREGKFHLGTFFDGDGDRIDFYHGDGRGMSSSFVYAAILPEIRRRFPPAASSVLADLRSSPLAVVEMAKAGVAVGLTRNGHAHIKKSMIDDRTRLGAVEESAHYYEAFVGDGEKRYCTENTLYVALLATRVWREQPERISQLLEIQETTAHEPSWGYKFPHEDERAAALQAVRELFESQGARGTERVKSGALLEATLIRRGVPLDIDQDTRLADDWLQVCQRVAAKDHRQARWEVFGATPAIATQAKRDIARCVRKFRAGEELGG